MKRAFGTVAGLAALAASGCGQLNTPQTGPLFGVPLAINGEEIGQALVDTGGGYEVMLRESFGLELLGSTKVLAFGGLAELAFSEGFFYSVGDIEGYADRAIVGTAICNCNGVGYTFFQKSGVVLGLDFPDKAVRLLDSLPSGDVVVDYLPPPTDLAGFESAFVEVDVSAGGGTVRVLAVLDTGSNVTVLREGLLRFSSVVPPTRVDAEVSHPLLGAGTVEISFFDTPGLPDLIIGTNLMERLGDEWYFRFEQGGGSVSVVFDGVSDDEADSDGATFE